MEARVVLGVVFDACDQHLRPVLLGGQRGRDAAGVVQLRGHEVLHAACGVIEVDGFDLRVVGQPAAALGEGDGVRQDAAQIAEASSGPGDDVVADAQEAFGRDADGLREQQVVVLRDGAVQAVFNGQHGARRPGR